MSGEDTPRKPDADASVPHGAEAATPLDRVLEGDASPEDIAAVTADPEASASADRWREIESAMRRTHAGPVAPDLDELERRRRPPAPIPFVGRRVGRRVAWSFAAAVLVVASAAIVLSTATGPTGGPEQTALIDRNAGTYYRMVTRDFTPTVICDTPEKFIAYTAEYLGVPLTAIFDTPVTLIGWRPFAGGYVEGAAHEPGQSAVDADGVLGADESAGARVLLARDGADRPVVVIFESASAAPITAGADLRVFTRRFGDVIATEITRADTVSVLDVVRPID